ncbi:hypothetical protein NUU61_003738 [Penicillium alfredii]|uniref:Uncharacterized protein n=1 Tax=Penicillium alfredii TaxID=1506179 RepID=A0A9W9FJT1_9EURO|nr:uncharacterized protein NUU61_003738 [Penicillium alfredii]KAJ5101516.1 hypothetical protein NUU61_003738 [Penicillium alfredii]
MACPHGRDLRQQLTPIFRAIDTGEKHFYYFRLKFRIWGACNVCNTDFLIEFREIDSKNALFITRWALALTKKTHYGQLTPTLAIRPVTYGGFDPDYSVEAQSPKARFEETASQSLEDLRSRNLSYLRDRQYRRIMRYANDSRAWHSPFRKPSTNRIVNFGRCLLGLLGIFPDPTSA